MTGVAAYVVLVVVLAALLLGHQGQDWPLRMRRPRWARQAREARCTPLCGPQGPFRLPRSLRDASEVSQARTAAPAPSWARTDKEAA